MCLLFPEAKWRCRVIHFFHVIVGTNKIPNDKENSAEIFFTFHNLAPVKGDHSIFYWFFLSIDERVKKEKKKKKEKKIKHTYEI